MTLAFRITTKLFISQDLSDIHTQQKGRRLDNKSRSAENSIVRGAVNGVAPTHRKECFGSPMFRNAVWLIKKKT